MEHKYESDLTKKEKRQMEIEKLKSMNFMEKLDYIWTYYKLWFAGALAVVALIYLGFTMYQGMQKNEVVSVAILGANMDADQIETLRDDVKDWMGAEGKNDVVTINANLSADNEESNSKIALTTLIGAQSVDVLICTQEIYEDYAEQDGFISGSLIFANTGFIKEMFGLNYDEVYVAILVNAPHSDGAERFVEYLTENADQEPTETEN
ncbi:hypothetical protein ACQRAW_00130 [Fusicatenibacter saccharivorans]|uniref:hypothetical protein n=1 Tax=Fusicatenibacter saccharivorans TaxID=1150298 RepID=UPI003D011FC4